MVCFKHLIALRDSESESKKHSKQDLYYIFFAAIIGVLSRALVSAPLTRFRTSRFPS
jgi:hypothetical protein